MSIGTTSTVRAPARSATATTAGCLRGRLDRPDVGDVDRLLGPGDAPEAAVRRRPDERLAPPRLGVGGRYVVQSSGAEAVSPSHRYSVPNLASQMPRRVRQHGLEHRLQLARRARDHAQHLGGRGLLLQRLGQLARARLHLVEQPHVLDRDHRLVGEGGHQLDLLVGERAAPCCAYKTSTPIGVAFAQQRHAEQGPDSRRCLCASRKVYSGSARTSANMNGCAFELRLARRPCPGPAAIGCVLHES